MGVALYGCEPRILKYCIDTVEGRMKKESEDKWCDNIIRWCRFGVKRNACESMVEVWVENWGKWILDSKEKKLEKEFFFWRKKKREKFDFGEMGIQREEREGVAGFQNFEDKFVFWLYKWLKCWCVFFGTHSHFFIGLETMLTWSFWSSIYFLIKLKPIGN